MVLETPYKPQICSWPVLLIELCNVLRDLRGCRLIGMLINRIGTSM